MTCNILRQPRYRYWRSSRSKFDGRRLLDGTDGSTIESPQPISESAPNDTTEHTTTVPSDKALSTTTRTSVEAAEVGEDTSRQIGREPEFGGESTVQITNGAPKSITNTIQQLELLLDEAVKVAQTAAEIQDHTTQVQSSSKTVRTEEKIPSKVESSVTSNLSRLSKWMLRNATLEKGTDGLDSTVSSRQQLRQSGDSSQLFKKKGSDTAENTAHENLSVPTTDRIFKLDDLLKSDRGIERKASFSPSPRHAMTPASRSRASTNRAMEIAARPIGRAIKPRTSSLPNCTFKKPDVTDTIPLLKLNGEGLSAQPSSERDFARSKLSHDSHFSAMFGTSSRQESMLLAHPEYSRKFDLRKRSEFDFPLDFNDESLHKTCNHAPVARNWPKKRKRVAAAVACLNTACIGLILGIYAGEVPAIQYVIIDLDHSIILGNVVLYIGLMFSTLLLWPLPVLHGRKPYTVAGFMLALCLQVPQGIAVISVRLPNQAAFKIMLLLARGLSGLALGMCDINLTATLLDLFGASLQSSHPHQEIPDPHDVRRHGGGIGVWLGIWSWCSLGPLSLGFMIGAFIVSHATVDWGFWTSQLLLMVVLLLNVAAPEVRRSAFRRTLIELISPRGEFGRIARGEVKMHLYSEGPSWWGEEVTAGFRLARMMLKQFGFFVLSIYTAWVYAQFVLILMLIGSLASSTYLLQPIEVGLCAMSVAVGALVAIPFQKASWLSRARSRRPRTDSMTLQTITVWSSHLVRRTIFTVMLPVSAIVFAVTLIGPPFPVAVPCLMAGFVGFFSNMAVAECHGILFEAFDTSDLQPGMKGRPARRSTIQLYANQRTNFSCYPRIMARISVIQAMKFGFAAVATAVTGNVTRSMGAQHATAVVAGILLGLTLLMIVTMMRWNVVQMIPEPFAQEDITTWEPTILGRPSGTTRKISIFEDGKLTRWSEIRRRNRLESVLTQR